MLKDPPAGQGGSNGVHKGRGGGDEVRGALGASLCEVRDHWKDLAFVLSQTGAKGELEVGDRCALPGSLWSCVEKTAGQPRATAAGH